MRPVIRQILSRPLDTLLTRGLTAEYRMDQRNLLKWSEDFSKSEWGAKSSGVTVVPNQEIAPDGTLTADLITFPLNGNYFGQGIGVPSGTYTYSIWVRSVSGNVDFEMDFTQPGSDRFSGIRTATTTWQRFIYSPSITAVSSNFLIITRTASSNSQLLIYGAQLELGSTPTTYQKTTDLQTLWNSKLTTMAVSNLVVNGDFSSGTSGWTPSSTSSFTVLNNAASFLATSNVGYISSPINMITGHVYYIQSKVKATSNLVKFSISGMGLVSHDGSGSYKTLSNRFDWTDSTGAWVIRVLDSRASGWNVVNVQEVFALDLTALFGAGNEPTLAQCDYLFNTWHDGTKVMDLPLYNGQSGSTTGADTNDPTFTGNSLSFTTDDYVKLPYSINAEQDFTVYVVANVGASAPSTSEMYWSAGLSSDIVPFCYVYRKTNGDIGISMRNNASTQISAVIAASAVVSGIRLLKVQRKSNQLSIKDAGNGIKSILDCPSSPMTLNQMALGCFLRSSAQDFTNQPEYFTSFHTCATTEAEDQRQLRAFKRELLKSGVKLGSKSEFFADFVGKVSGSTVENGNVFSVPYGIDLISPINFIESPNYSGLSLLDGSLRTSLTSGNGEKIGHGFSFNIIRDIEDKGVVIPASDLAGKVQWVKDNVAGGGIVCNWYGRGTSPAGNKASLDVFVVGASWSGAIQSHTNGTVTKLARTLITPNLCIDANGFIHFLAYAEPSDGITASTIYTDTANLLITLKNGVVLGG